MFTLRDRNTGRSNSRIRDKGLIQAIERSMAVIEFDTNGIIQNANENFLHVVGYSLDEIVGKHHRIFVNAEDAASQEYADFWHALKNGEYYSREFRRFSKTGQEIWLQATYNPVFNENREVVGVIKFATDITIAKYKSLEDKGLMEAIDRAEAVIKFTPDGTILDANQNFLNAMGYKLSEIVGQHHSLFLSDGQSQSPDYAAFWGALRQGKPQTAQFKRFGKNEKPVWIQATYNPIKDPSGKVTKVVKIASDVTRRVERERNLSSRMDTDLTGIADHAQSVSAQTTQIASEVARTSGTIQDVASATEELSASTREITRIVQTSRDSANSAQALTEEAGGYTVELDKTTTQMSGIVEIINDIAGQINLLSLNATIESARAGEAGKGFAVVASEVKQLAGQVSNATKTISEDIAGVQNVSGQVINALNSISSSMTDIIADVSQVATAVEQQSSATAEISSRMQVASSAVVDIDHGINEVAKSVSETSRISSEVKDNVQALLADQA